MFSNYSGVKLEINSNKKYRKFPNIQKFSLVFFISSAIPFWFGNILYMIFNLFQCIETCFVIHHMVYFGECSICRRKEYVFCCCWVESSTNVNQVKLLDSFVQIFHILCLLALQVTEHGVITFPARIAKQTQTLLIGRFLKLTIWRKYGKMNSQLSNCILTSL